MNKFFQNYSALKIYLSHLEEIINPIEKNKHQIDKAMVKEYIQRQTNEISNFFQSIIDSIVELNKIFEKVEEDSYFFKGFNFLHQNFKQLYPDPSQETEGKFECILDADKIKNWKNRLDSLYDDIFTAYFMILIDGLQKG